MSLDQLISEVLAYIRNNGGRYQEWYAGITSDPQERMFTAHGVRKDGDSWIFRDAGHETTARDAEKHLLSLGMLGDTGGGDYSTKYVYAYKVRPHTSEA